MPTWTPEQLKVIETRNCNLLVSAAAGSGKTAVLVERILSMITDKISPLDIDRLLVVTFTNAAASEMRERIGQAIEKCMEQMPEDEHLQRQATLVHMASITTIDSFCMRVLREHFDKTELDPSFRVGDEGELKLLKADVAEALLEEYYREGNQDFFDFVESYSTGKSDAGLEELIEKLYEFSMSHPEPEEWLASALGQYQADTIEEWNETDSAKFLVGYMKSLLKDCVSHIQKGLNICKNDDGPIMYKDALSSDLEQLKELLYAEDYASIGEQLRVLNFVRLSAKKSDTVSPEKKEQVKALRDDVKEDIKSLLKQFYSRGIDEIMADMQTVRRPLQMVITLTQEFLRRYAEKKREKNLIDFHDVEHFALQLLAKKNEQGDWIPTETAAEYREQFAEIMIDEYQDSNFVQEVILTSISREAEGKPNVFMVGDVKQSIYKFRMARPELFMEKYNEYSLEGGEYQKIDLHKNFRSRREVIYAANVVFEHIMARELGGIVYDGEAKLYFGADIKAKPAESTEPVSLPETGQESLPEPEAEAENQMENPQEMKFEPENKTELYLIEKKVDAASDTQAQEFSSGELEAKVIAGQIRRLTGENGMLVWDKSKEEYRRACYRDIVILLRSVGSYADAFLSVFSEEGIPAYAQSQNGYFTAVEVQTVLNFLRVLDNPRQDIPLTGVLKSPLVGMKAAELAKLRADFPEGGMYDSLQACAETKTHEFSATVRRVLENMQRMRDMAAYTPIHELIRIVIRETGYGDYIMAMPAGQKRRQNLDMLIEKAYAFEATSYRGLFQFLRYIEKLKKYEVDYGEAPSAGENEDTVRIMSIHKSKGLEFPIVFLAGMGRRFNQQDATEKIILHPTLGISGDYVDYKKRTRSVTLTKRIMQKQIRLENLAEELRVLYVAMTRAKEKLILTGAVTDVEKRKKDWELKTVDYRDEALSYSALSGANSYLDWIVPACESGSKGYKSVPQVQPEEGKTEKEMLEEKAEREMNPTEVVRVYTVGVPEVVEAEVSRKQEQLSTYELLRTWDAEAVYDLPVREKIEEHFSYEYSYPADVALHGKVSVSEIKKRSQQLEAEENEESEILIEEEPPLLPEFIHGKQEHGGVERGTLYHRVLERLVLSGTDTRDEIETQLDRMTDSGILNAEERGKLNSWKLWKLFAGEIGKRMKAAEKNGILYREQPFVLGRSAKEFYPEIDSEELVLMQGIIDVYFEEDGELVLLDYKTDYVGENGEDILKKRYRVQFDCYRQALEQMTGKHVKEMILYSFYMDKEIRM